MSVPPPMEGRTGKLRRWGNGWRMALRMAGREVRRDRGRSLFVWLMIALPVTTICALQVVIASNDISDAERLELRLGFAQAVLTPIGEGFVPVFDGTGTAQNNGEGGIDTRPVPGWGNTLSEHEAALGDLVGRPVLAVTSTSLAFGNARVGLTSLGLDPAGPGAERVVQLRAGRMPSSAEEALVTPAGTKAGLPPSGTVTLRRDDDSEVTLSVVGAGESRLDDVFDLVTVPDVGAENVRFMVTGGAPVTWTEAQNLAGYGFETASRGIADQPPERVFRASEASRTFFIWSVIAAALLEVALVVGPAFAIGAARQRRGLALAASNGATPAQLRRTATGQAVLIGASAALFGVLVGTLVGVFGWTGLAPDPRELRGPLDIPVGQLLGSFGLGLATAVGAALVTTRGLARLDIVATLRGSLRSAPPRRGAPVIGGLLAAAGLAGVWLAMSSPSAFRFWVWVLGALAVLAGVLLCVPALLLGLSRLAGPAPMAVRMAIRDISRQRGRATSTVAAVLAGGLILTTVWTILLSLDVDAARRYRSDFPIGQASFDLESDSPQAVNRLKAVVSAVDPTLRTAHLGQIGGRRNKTQEPDTITALRPGCTVGDLADYKIACASLGSGDFLFGSGILTGTTEELTAVFGLSAEQQRDLSDERLLVNTDPVNGNPDWAEHHIVKGTIRFAYLSETAKPRTVDVPATAITGDVIARGATTDRFGALITSASADKLSWAVSQNWLRVIDPGGPLSPDLEGRLSAAVQAWDPIPRLDVERGFQPAPQPLVWGVTATLILLAVIAAVIATVMSTTELRPFLATFAAVGADHRLTRRLAAVQASLLSGLGTIAGCGIGALIAMPLAMTITGEQETNPLPSLVAFPWTLIGGLVIGVPMVSAIVAALCVPARPALARRAT